MLNIEPSKELLIDENIFMRQEVKIIVDKIYSDLTDQTSGFASLMTGQAGIVLFKCCYPFLSEKNEDQNSGIENEIQTLAEQVFSRDLLDFGNGRSGVLWLFNFLNQKNILSDESVEIFTSNDELLMKHALNVLSLGNYDFLYGALGIAWYFIGKNDVSYNDFISLILRKLFTLAETSFSEDGAPYFNFIDNIVENNHINLGLAHGIPSIIKFCSECYKRKIQPDLSKTIAYIHIEYLLKKKNKDSSVSIFSKWIKRESDYSPNSGLAWCYGDLSIGYVLLHAGKTFEDAKLIHFSSAVLKETTLRTSLNHIPKDACFCHGTSGIAHIYNRLWKYTSDTIYKEASEFWINKTLEYAIHNDSPGGFKKYSPVYSKNIYEGDTGLLMGISGIGLALTSYLTQDFDWDFCLMLNN